MKISRRFVLGAGAMALALVNISSTVGLAQRGAPPVPLVDRDHLRMNPEAALTGSTVVVFGDQSKPGMYVIRNRFAPGATSRPHFHDADRYITVIKGTWWTDEGDVFRADKMVPLKPGGFMFHPAGLHHYDGSMDNEEVIVQIMGMGPVKTIQTEVDASGKPVGANPLAPKP